MLPDEAWSLDMLVVWSQKRPLFEETVDLDRNNGFVTMLSY